MRKWLAGLFALMLVVTFAANSEAKPRIYKWVKDKKVNSDQILRKTEFTRVYLASESTALELSKQVMTDGLFLSLGEYHASRHQQDGESSPDTVLPEEVIRQTRVDLADEDYRFILEVTLKKNGGDRTRIAATAWPVYRIRDAEAEDARDEDATGSGNSIEVKVHSDRSSAVAVGPLVIAPIIGYPGDYGITPLPDAAERSAKLVKSFMYLLDKQMALRNKGNAASPKVETIVSQPVEAETIAGNEDEQGGVDVEIKMKSK